MIYIDYLSASKKVKFKDRRYPRMAKTRPNVDYIQLDERNALIFDDANTEYIMSKVREATKEPARRTEIYGEMARRFCIDPDKMNMAVIKYVDRMKRDSARKKTEERGVQGSDEHKQRAAMDERVRMAALCREVGHRFVHIALSHKHGCRECERCGKHESRYNI
jgi:hypothetical protein